MLFCENFIDASFIYVNESFKSHLEWVGTKLRLAGIVRSTDVYPTVENDRNAIGRMNPFKEIT